MPGKVFVIALAGLVGVAAAPARAEQVAVKATGAARAGDDARTRALDRAFVRAVDQVLAQLVTAETRARQDRPLREHILRRARIYVESFRVVNEQTREGRLELAVQARVEKDAIADKLDDLGIDRNAAAAPGPIAGRPKVVVLLAVSAGDGTAATFGASGTDGGPAGRAFADELREHGFEVTTAAGESVPVSRESSPGLPVSDEAAADLARRVGAGGAFVVGVEATGAGAIRATRLEGAVARAAVRVVDVDGLSLVARGEADGAGFGDDPALATAAAARDAAERAMQAVGSAATEYWPAETRERAAMTVTIRGAPSWAPIEAIVDQLESTPGVDRVTARGFDRGAVMLAVSTSLGARRIAASARSAAVTGNALRTSAPSDRRVTVDVLDRPSPTPSFHD